MTAKRLSLDDRLSTWRGATSPIRQPFADRVQSREVRRRRMVNGKFDADLNDAINNYNDAAGWDQYTHHRGFSDKFRTESAGHAATLRGIADQQLERSNRRGKTRKRL